MKLTQEELKQIARLIKEGNTRGFLDREEENGEYTRIVWDLTIDFNTD